MFWLYFVSNLAGTQKGENRIHFRKKEFFFLFITFVKPYN